MYPIPNLHEFKTQKEYAIALQDKLQEVYQIAREHLKANAERLRKDHDSRLTKYQYKERDLVYKFDKTVQKKFQSPWLGPYIITKMLSTVVYEICCRSRIKVVHYDRLKPYLGEIPDWVKRKFKQLE